MSQYERNLWYKSNMCHPELVEGCHTSTSLSMTPDYDSWSYFSEPSTQLYKLIKDIIMQ
ncbi:MAG: hypothetical protein ACXABG_11680 [Promethearchaeota archaeon]|jgi:hypothetical protein